MSESTFGADLDALVRGERVVSNDDLTHFASDLYGEEQNVTMPNALKLRIANDLGLASAKEPTRHAAPVSRRTLRASEPQRRSSRPWAIALTIAAAVLLALTGILRLGMLTGNDEPDNRFLFSSPAVPTVAATPAASPESATVVDQQWLQPIWSEECPESDLLDRGQWMELMNEKSTRHDEADIRQDQPYSRMDDEDAEQVALRQRQAIACMNSEDSLALPIESPRRSWEWQADPATNQAIQEDRLERSKELSLWVEMEEGLAPADLIYPTETEPGPVWPPSQAIEMGDGRIALIPGWLATGQETPSSFEFFAPVWMEIDGDWLLDEELFFCIGECDGFWEKLESEVLNIGTAEATPAASPESDLSWQLPISPEECVIADIGELPNAEPEAFDAQTDRSYTVVGPADSTDAYAANDVVRQYMACDNPPALLSDQAAVEASLSDGGSFPVTVAMLDRQLMDGMHLSAQLEEQGLTPEDTVVNADVGPTGFFAPNPEIAFVLEDGRVLIMTVAVSGSADGTQWSVGSTLLLVQEDGEWKVDEQVPVCIGSCDDTFAEIESLYTNALWLSPVTAEECERNSYLPAGLSDEQAAAIRGRQYIACEMNGDVQQLQGPDYRVTEGEAARPVSDEIALLHRQNGEAPGNLQRIAPEYMMPMTEFPSEPWRAYQPQSVVMLADGRIAALEASVISPEIISASNRSSPVITTALVWVVDGDSWSLDEEVTVCLGICDAFWGDEIAATPVALEETPESVVIPETCEGSDEFVAHFTSHDRLPIQLRPNPIMEAGVYVEVLDPRAPLQYLCESEETTNPTLDRMDEGQRWLKIRTEDGTEGWIREVDVREYQP